MCTIIFSYQQHPQYQLILAANRDEFYTRETKVLDYWTEYPGILAGKDEVGGGTWIGVSKEGRWSAITNYRVPFAQLKADGKSRGKLTLDFLTTQQDTETYLRNVMLEDDLYNGYNLLLGTQKSLAYYSNVEKKLKKLSTGVYGLSNHLLNTAWFKSEKGVKGLQEVTENEGFNPYHLFDVLRDNEKAPENRLPDTSVPKDWELQLSSIFIDIPERGYGTCCSTVLLIDYAQNVRFIEKSYAPQNEGIVKDFSFMGAK